MNIVLDLVFIIQFHAGAAGAAYATVISQGVSGVLCLLYIWKKVPVLHLKRSDWRLDWHIAKLQLGLGLPMALQYSITAIGTIMVQSALNSLGSTLVAAFTAASKIEQVVTQAYVALGTAMATFCAQNMGAGKISRIRRGFKDATLMGIVYSLFAALLVVTVGKYMTYLFISEEIETILPSVDIYLKCVAAFFIPLTVVNLYRNGLQGMGFGFLSDDGRRGRAGGARRDCGDCGGLRELFRHLYGQSHGLGAGRRTAHPHVLLYHEAVPR